MCDISSSYFVTHTRPQLRIISQRRLFPYSTDRSCQDNDILSSPLPVATVLPSLCVCIDIYRTTDPKTFYFADVLLPDLHSAGRRSGRPSHVLVLEVRP